MLKEMMNLCKKEKSIDVLKYGKQRFLESTSAAACLDLCAPDWTIGDILTALEIPDEERDDYVTGKGIEQYDTINPDNLIECVRLTYSINVGGCSLQPFMLKDGRAFFVDEKNLKIFHETSMCKYYYAVSLAGDPALIVAKDNGYVVGFIRIIKVDADRMGNFATSLSDGIYRAALNGFNVFGGQMSLTDL